MKKLAANWITEGILDFEYKKYVLLAYLQDVGKHFKDSELYPFMNELIFHYNNLLTLRNNKQYTEQAFPKEVSRLDIENFTIEYKRLLEDDDYLAEVSAIVDFALPRIKTHLNNGKELYEYAEENIIIEPIGLIPINKDLGYMLLRSSGDRRTEVYEYQVTLYHNAEEPYRSIRTTYIGKYALSINNTLERVKQDLLTNKKGIQQPATYAIESKVDFPWQPTFLPIAKRKFMRYLAQA